MAEFRFRSQVMPRDVAAQERLFRRTMRAAGEGGEMDAGMSFFFAALLVTLRAMIDTLGEEAGLGVFEQIKDQALAEAKRSIEFDRLMAGGDVYGQGGSNAGN